MYIKNSRGFTLLEMAIVMIIAGIIFGIFGIVLNQYLQKKNIEGTNASINTAHEGISKFYSEYRRLPCPGPLYENASYEMGEDTDCTDTSVAPGSCGNGYCVASSSKLVDHDGNTATPPQQVRIRIGAVPFDTLKHGIEEDIDADGVLDFNFYHNIFQIGLDNTLDYRKNRLVYAMTESQATANRVDGISGIVVKDEYGNETDDLVEYVIVSNGDNTSGAFASEAAGPPATCSGISTDEQENCDLDGDFVASIPYEAIDSTTYFDDIVSYQSFILPYQWDYTEESRYDATFDTVYNLNFGRVGVGLIKPEDKLHIKGGDAMAESAVRSMLFCDENGEDCFWPELVAGDHMDQDGAGLDTSGPGDDCNIRSGMTAIAYNKRTCREISVNNSGACNPGEYAYGFEYDTQNQQITVLCDPGGV